MKKSHRVLLCVFGAIALTAYVSAFALAQPTVGISKAPPIIGLGNNTSPLRLDPCPPGFAWVSTSSTGNGTWGCVDVIDSTDVNGLANRVAKFTATHQIGSGSMVDDGVSVEIGTAIAMATPLSLTATSNQSLILTRYGGSAGVVFRAALGTAGAPTALTANGFLGGLRSSGYHSGGAFSTPQTYLVTASAEDWTSSAQGTYLLAYTTPIGSTAATNRLKIDSAGNVGIGGYDTGAVGHKLEVQGTGDFTGALTEASNRVFSLAGVGLTSSGPTVNVACGTGITCAADSISVDMTAILSGTASFLPKFTSANAVGNSTVSDDGAGTVTDTFSGGPTLSFDDSSTTAAPKTTTRQLFRAKDASGTQRTQAQITVEQSDKTNSSNDARFYIDLVSGGALTNGFRIQSTNSADPLAKDGELWDTDLGRNGCVPSATVHCGEVWIHADDVDIGGTMTWGKIDGSGTTTGYGAGALGIANGGIPAADWVFGKNLTVVGKTYLTGAAGVDINGQLYTYVDPLFPTGATIGNAAGSASDLNGTISTNGTAGTNGQVLQIVSGLPKWSTVAFATGTGTIDKYTKWSSTSGALVDGKIADSGANVIINGSSGVTVSTSGATIGGASGLVLDASNVDAIGGTLNIQAAHPTGTINLGLAGFSLAAINALGPLNASFGASFTGSGNTVSISGTFQPTNTRVQSTGRVSAKGNGLTVSSCGAGGAATGDSEAFRVNLGTGTVSPCVVTLPVTFSNAPVCVVSPRSGSKPASYTTSTTALTITSATASDIFDVICRDLY